MTYKKNKMTKKQLEKEVKLFLEVFTKAVDQLVEIIKLFKRAFEVLEPYFLNLLDKNH